MSVEFFRWVMGLTSGAYGLPRGRSDGRFLTFDVRRPPQFPTLMIIPAEAAKRGRRGRGRSGNRGQRRCRVSLSDEG